MCHQVPDFCAAKTYSFTCKISTPVQNSSWELGYHIHYCTVCDTLTSSGKKLANTTWGREIISGDPKEPSDIDISRHTILQARGGRCIKYLHIVGTLYCKLIAPLYDKPLAITSSECYLWCGKLHQQHKQTRCTEFSQKEETGGIVAWSCRHARRNNVMVG